MNSLILASLQSCFSLPPLFFVGTNVKSSAETSWGTAAFWTIQCSAPAPTWIFSLTNSFLPMFLFIFFFFCVAYSFIFISHFNLLSPSSMLSVPSKINRACSLGWILLAAECPWFTLGVQGAHDWVHYKFVTMSLMAQIPWDYFRSWAQCLCRKRNAFITLSLQASGSGWVMQNQKEQLAWSYTACVRKRTGSWQCLGRNRTLGPRGRTRVLSEAGKETVPQKWGQHMILPWITKSIIQERRWQCAFLVSRASPWGSCWPGYSAITALLTSMPL